MYKRQERASADIFRYIADHPEKAPQIRKFMNYYLPTDVYKRQDPLLASLPYHPFLIKPNLEELCQLFQAEGPLTPLEAKEYAKELQRMGARNVVVSLGEKGALLLEESGRCLGCRSPRGQAVSTVGAGDSLVAGFLYGCQLLSLIHILVFIK